MLTSCALVLLMIGRRLTIKGETDEPGNLILTSTGAGLLWFGFNAGSAIAAATPAASHVEPRWALLICMLVGVICYFAVN